MKNSNMKIHEKWTDQRYTKIRKLLWNVIVSLDRIRRKRFTSRIFNRGI